VYLLGYGDVLESDVQTRAPMVPCIEVFESSKPAPILPLGEALLIEPSL
jgi:hypothetical protein